MLSRTSSVRATRARKLRTFTCPTPTLHPSSPVCPHLSTVHGQPTVRSRLSPVLTPPGTFCTTTVLSQRVMSSVRTLRLQMHRRPSVLPSAAPVLAVRATSSLRTSTGLLSGRRLTPSLLTLPSCLIQHRHSVRLATLLHPNLQNLQKTLQWARRMHRQLRRPRALTPLRPSQRHLVS